MTVCSNKTPTAQIIDMRSLLNGKQRMRAPASSLAHETATLLSIRQNLTYQAAMGVDDIASIRTNYSNAVADELLLELRQVLNVEFGRLRIYRRRQIFAVSHHCLETLIAGLLRVQFHGKQIELPAINVHGELSENVGVSLTWGVGNSVAEAETEIRRRYRLKRS